jgi:hypothetical protein
MKQWALIDLCSEPIVSNLPSFLASIATGLLHRRQPQVLLLLLALPGVQGLVQGVVGRLDR